jgi:phosphopantothenoylcysteine synthetase/decarboxylase
MAKAKVFEFNSFNEVLEKFEKKDLELSLEIFKQIKKAVNSKAKKKQVRMFTVKIKDSYLEFTLERDQWKKALNTCMDSFADNDLVEECIEIQNILKSLNENDS